MSTTQLRLIFNSCDINPCPADLNRDGLLNFFDVSAFLSAYQNQQIADFNNDGQFSFFDVSAYLSAYNAGCP
ncbi:MAG: GC-type dockerin domain-anchored protein [Phycisphaerales bacterium]